MGIPPSLEGKSASWTKVEIEEIPGRVQTDPLTEAEGLDLVGILSSIDETAYVWDLASDKIDWESNAGEILGVPRQDRIATGAAFQLLISPEHLARRTQAFEANVAGDATRGVTYRIQYRFLPVGRRSDKSVWLEDHGRWWPGLDGKPARARGVLRVINDRYWEEQKLLYRSDHDELTGQLNRIRLTESLSAVLGRTQRTGQPCAFLMAAVNNLAVVNETFGFDVGDEVIAAAARKIKERLRGGDVLGRYSSNKFGIILHDCGPGAMRIAAERFMKGVREHTIATSACHLTATLSIGGVIMPDQADTVQKALNYALHALDRAKTKRFDCFMNYEPVGAAETTRRKSISVADDVIEALDHQRMGLVLQPMIGAKTGRSEIYECLLRMERPDGSIVSAGEFIPIAEQLGLSRLIDRRTLELSIGILKRHPAIKLSLNVSGLTCSDHEWLVALQRLTGGRKDLTSRLIIEITETAAIQDLDQSINFVDTLKELGCRVAIDDFGAGYTSFKNLKLLNVDMVKIDGAFVKNMADDTSDQIFIKTMIELANTFGLETVAEWVADERSVELLKKAGITYLQGFYYGLPIEAEKLDEAG
ncbi:MAG TPA: EAL domain-containing protein [Hyphomicrobium sp.]|nr:EAL domain-containing protein [Hyphomicrobium sp.]